MPISKCGFGNAPRNWKPRTGACATRPPRAPPPRRRSGKCRRWKRSGLLTGGIAHDFNNMLAIVVGSLDIAKRHLGDREKAQRFIANAMQGAQRGAQLTARLLAFSRQQPLDARPLDTNELVRDMSNLLTRSIGENIRLETRLQPRALAYLRRRVATRERGGQFVRQQP